MNAPGHAPQPNDDNGSGDFENLNTSEQSSSEPAADLAAPASGDAEDLQIRVQILEQELDRTKDQMIRALAETDNIRKRGLREREDAQKFAVSAFSRDLLSVADNLRRALAAVPAELAEATPEIKNLLSGIEATERELLKSFEKNGIQKIEPLDEKFDPNFHEVMFEAVIPSKPAGTIIQVIEAGYTLNGRLLRPARVGVAKSDSQGPVHAVDTSA
jgi:molecular chaperone GrpE